MLYKVINEWLEEKFDILNLSLPPAEQVKNPDMSFDTDLLPANLKDNTYMVMLHSIGSDDNESGSITVNVSVEFHFRLYKKPKEHYRKLIDEKLFALCRILTDVSAAGLEYESDSITIANIHKISVAGLDKAYKGGEYLFPRIEFELQVFYNEQ